ncbi:MAG TPA: hypothetical protein VMH23_13655 [Bacteroidota bacterium]|nr:hypothetical protein [Bacteroidota bacterium]
MRRAWTMLPVLALAFVAGGCDHSFNPKEEFKDEYVLQCFVQVTGPLGSPSTVTAVIARTYNVDGYDPSTNTVDPAIAGAEVTLTVNQKSYVMLGLLRTNPDTTRYQTKQWVYSKSVSIITPDAPVSITAKLPNGKVLSARTTIPSSRTFTSNYDFSAGLTSPFTLQPGKPNWLISWYNPDDIEVHLFVPRLTITYTKLVGSDEVTGTVSVPSRYIPSASGSIPYYPSLTTDEQCTFEFATLDSAMAWIAAGDPDKVSYGVHSARLEVIEYDLPLTKYFSSINGSLDQFSVRTDESVYSNVSGGIGIFGSYVIQWIDYTFDPRYVQRFGYRYR